MMAIFRLFDTILLTKVAVAVLLMVLLTFQQVLARYLFNESSVAVQELLWHLFGFTFLLSSGLALRRNRHVRVDIFYGRANVKTRTLIDMIGITFFLLPSMGMLAYYGFFDVLQTRSYGMGASKYQLLQYVTGSEGFLGEFGRSIDQWLFKGEASPDPGGLPARWIVKAMIPLGALLCFIAALVTLFEKIRQWQRGIWT